MLKQLKTKYQSILSKADLVGKKNYALILHKCHITDKNQEGGISYIHNKKTYVLCPQIYGRFNYHANIVTCYL